MDENRKYLYAKKEEQIKRANKFIVASYVTFYLVLSIFVFISYLRNIRTLSYTSTLLSIVLFIIVVTIIMYIKNKHDPRIKYIASAGLMIVTFLVAFAFDNYYIRFMATIPLTVNILSYDKKFFIIFGIINSALNIFTTYIKTFVTNVYTGEAIIDNWSATLAIISLMLVLYLTVNIGKRFNDDAMGQLEEEKATQKNMLDAIINIAEEVRSGTESAMDIVNELNESTDIVNSAVGDISESTSTTAEDIQTQTVMTNNIQNSIADTLKRSENMVQVANESDDLNSKNLELIQEIMQQSTSIADINSNVASSMDKLQERTNTVKNIAEAIYSISSQTNLLALNASIESARAGESGKGFAVVADEVRQLAEKTRAETESIAIILDELSQEAEEVATAINHSVSATQTQNELINQASESFGHMNKNVNELITDIAGIDKMLNGLSEANNQIVDNIVRLSATSEEVTASSDQSAELSNNNLIKAEDTKQMLKHVLEVSYQIDQYLMDE